MLTRIQVTLPSMVRADMAEDLQKFLLLRWPATHVTILISSDEELRDVCVKSWDGSVPSTEEENLVVYYIVLAYSLGWTDGCHFACQFAKKEG